LIHGARAALPTLLESPTPLGAWLRGLMTRMHKKRRCSRAGQQAGAYGLGSVTTQRDVPFRRLGDDIVRICRLRIAMTTPYRRDRSYEQC
jgi:hypothetical protein